MISMSMREGTLVVQDAVSRKSFHFGPKGVRVLSAGERKGMRLGEILVRTERITAGKLREVLESAAAAKKKLGQALVVAVALPVLALLRGTAWDRRLARGSSVAILLAGVVLFLERTLL